MKLKIKLDEYTRPILEAAHQAQVRISNWPAWKRGWFKLSLKGCDLCPGAAAWSHSDGGLRCNECPKP